MVSKAITTAVTILVCFVLPALPPAAAQEQTSMYDQLLRGMGIEPDAPSLETYLVSLHPDDQAKQEMAAQIRQLGSDDFFEREAATRVLLRQPAVPVEMLERVISGEDPEIRWRAKLILDQADQRAARVLHAIYHVIQQRQLKGLTEPVLMSLPYCSQQYLQQAARGATRATATADDLPLLREYLVSGTEQQRRAAIPALGSLAKEEAVADLVPLLSEEPDAVRLQAALALANLGKRQPLATLVDLLSSDELSVRVRANKILSDLTGKDFTFVAYEEPPVRAVAVGKWQTWVAKEGPTAELSFPIKEARPMLGRTLIAFYSTNRVIELDRSGKRVWEQQINQPWGCQGLPNGHRLVCSYNQGEVVEYDSKGDRVVWKLSVAKGRPFNVRRLENGNTLLPYYSEKKIVEIDYKTKKEVWSIDVPTNPMDARRLPNGNTLVCLLRSNSVVELDRKGKTVWTLPNMPGPRSASRLENGNTLVCQANAGKVVEVTHDKNNVVWSKDGLSSPFDAQRLPNGNTLIAHAQGVMEVDREGKTVWQERGAGASSVYRY